MGYFLFEEEAFNGLLNVIGIQVYLKSDNKWIILYYLYPNFVKFILKFVFHVKALKDFLFVSN